jgi:hypothetical protein
MIDEREKISNKDDSKIGKFSDNKLEMMDTLSPIAATTTVEQKPAAPIIVEEKKTEEFIPSTENFDANITPKSQPRRSRWDVAVDVCTDSSSPRTSPMKNTAVPTTEPIIFDYKRDKNLCMKLSLSLGTSEPSSTTSFQRRLSFDKIEPIVTAQQAKEEEIQQQEQVKSNEPNNEIMSGQKQNSFQPAKRKVDINIAKNTKFIT